jgi:hypothetical protein
VRDSNTFNKRLTDTGSAPFNVVTHVSKRLLTSVVESNQSSGQEVSVNVIFQPTTSHNNKPRSSSTCTQTSEKYNMGEQQKDHKGNAVMYCRTNLPKKSWIFWVVTPCSSEVAPTFRINISLTSSGSRSTLRNKSAEGGDKHSLLIHTVDISPNYVTLQARRPHFSVIPVGTSKHLCSIA